MAPSLSIITTNYNYTDKLPGLFDNIMAQTLKDYEVIVVDDCSDTPCTDVVEAYRNKGLDIRLVQNTARQYTKETRLNGVEAARGKLITFIDADDLFYGTKALEFHLHMALESEIDILQFAPHLTVQGATLKPPYDWALPLADSLNGKEIFNTFVKKKMLASVTIWGKIITRKLWMQCLAPARASSVRRYSEDVYLSSLLYFHATSYKGSTRIGYEREEIDAKSWKSFGRAMTAYAMLTEFLPYIYKNGANILICAGVRAALYYRIKRNIALWLESERINNVVEINDKIYNELFTHGNYEQIIKTIVTGIL